MVSVEWVAREISRVAQSEDVAKAIVNKLTQIDWSRVFNEDRKACDACGAIVPRFQLTWKIVGDIPFCCPSCLKKATDGYNRICDECGNTYFTTSISKHEICDDCKTQRYGKPCIACGVVYWPCSRIPVCQLCMQRRGLNESWERSEYVKVQTHVGRALKMGLPGAFTLHEWMVTLNNFNWKCAYCLTHSYEQLDHFIPLCKGGGTIVSNCVPSCKDCNKRKGQRHPDQVKNIPQDTFVRVRSYLQQFS